MWTCSETILFENLCFIISVYNVLLNFAPFFTSIGCPNIKFSRSLLNLQNKVRDFSGLWETKS